MTDMVDKIRALRAKARDSASTEAEAALFAEKVQELMEKHHIEESQLDEVRAEHEQVSFRMRYANGWRRTLATAIGMFTGCAFSWVPGTETGKWVGRPHATRTAMEMYEHLEQECVRIPRTVYSEASQYKRAEKGVALGLCVKLDEIRRNLPESRLPVVQEFDAAYEAQASMMPNLKSSRIDNKIDTAEAYAGFKAADQIHIQKRTES